MNFSSGKGIILQDKKDDFHNNFRKYDAIRFNFCYLHGWNVFNLYFSTLR